MEESQKKQKATSIIEKHLEMLNNIDMDMMIENPALLIAVTDSLKRTIGLLLILDKI